MEDTFSEILTIEMAKLLLPLKKLGEPTSLTALIRELGWDLGEGVEIHADVGKLIGKIGELPSLVMKVVDAANKKAKIQAVKDLIGEIYGIVKLIPDAASKIESAIKTIEDFKNEQGIASVFASRLLDYLVFVYLEENHFRLFSVLYLLRILEFVEENEVSLKTVVWERILDCLSSPMAIADAYQWNSVFESDEFLKRLEILMRAFVLPGGLYQQSALIKQKSTDWQELRIPIYQAGKWPEEYAEFDINLSPLPPLLDENGNEILKTKGLALYPYLVGSFDIEQSWENWTIRMKSSAKLDGELGLILRPPDDIKIGTIFLDELPEEPAPEDDPFEGASEDDGENTQEDLETPSEGESTISEGDTPPASDTALEGGATTTPVPEPSQDAHIELSIQRVTPEKKVTIIFGDEDSTYLGYEGFGFKILIDSANQKIEAGFEVEVNGLTFVFSPGSGDSFIQKLFSGIRAESVTDLAIGISTSNGISFRGSGLLELMIAIHKQIGPVNIHAVYIGLTIDGDISLVLATSFSASLGPVDASLEKIGLLIPIKYCEDRSGNLGPLEVSELELLPPKGAGLSINAAGITGGGFLDFDKVNGRYTGVLALSFEKWALSAVGIITTKLPDGSHGFALLISIGVTFNPPIQLGYGFTLSGVGGLIAVNRSMNIDALRSGIRDHALDSILFPDPDTLVANANRIISDMERVFPQSPGQYIVGPMIKIGWGTPAIITGTLGIFIEFPDPVRIVVLGQMSAAFPREEEAIVVVHLDVLGVIDFGREEFSFQASLYDSRILTFSMYGDAAFLVGWGRNPRFALSLGGFHPKFTPPEPASVFANLRRMTIDISAGSDLQLCCTSYQALTSNSLQFGARLDLCAAGGGFKLAGYLGFDALFYFSPFSFEVEIRGGVRVSYHGTTLFGVKLSLLLSGPTPWHARGQATFEILFVEIDIDFSFTWGSDTPAVLEPINPLGPLQEALNAPGAWRAVLPGEGTMIEVLRPLEGKEAEMVVAHPAGRLEVRQSVLPLNVNIKKFNNAPIKEYDRFCIASIKVGTKDITEPPAVEDYFARGQYEDLSSEQRLSLPSFELMDAGISTGSIEDFGPECIADEWPLEYDSKIVLADGTSLSCDELHQEEDTQGGLLPRPVGPSQGSGTKPPIEWFNWDQAAHLVAAGMHERSRQRNGPRKRFSSFHPSRRIEFTEERFQVVNTDTLTRVAGKDGDPMSRMAADQVAKRNPSYCVVPECEAV